jgi:DNA topoisomerase II
MILVNGSDGIGTGWSSKIPNYDPRQIISNIRKLIAGEQVEKMRPSYSGFNGTISLEEPGKYQVMGIIQRLDATTLHVTELPVRTWTQDFKAMLDKMLVPGEKETLAEIKDFQEFHTDTIVKFVINAEESKIDQWEKIPKGGLYAKFKLISSISTTNMHAFDTEHKIVKYGTPEAILQSFFDLRMEFYNKRKTLLLQKLHRQQALLSNKARFVEEVCSGELVVSSRKKAELLEELRANGYEMFHDKKDAMPSDDIDEENQVEETTSLSHLAKGYEYLLGMKIWSLTFEKAEELRAQLAERTAELHKLEKTSPSTIWSNDLDAIEEALDVRDEQITKAEQAERMAQEKTAKRQATKQKHASLAKKRIAKKKDEWNSEDEDKSSDVDMDFDDVTAVKPSITGVCQKAVDTVVNGPTKAPASTKSSALTSKARNVTKAALNQTSTESYDEDEDHMEPSLMGNLKKKNKRTNENSSSADCIKRPSPKSSEATSLKRSKLAKKAPAKPKKKKVVDSDDEDEFDFGMEDSEMEITVAPPPPANRSRRTARTTVKHSYVDDGSDSDF